MEKLKNMYEENKYDCKNFPTKELLEACKNVRDNYINTGIFTFILELLLFVGTLPAFIISMDDGFNEYLIAPLLTSLFVLTCLLYVVHDMYIFLYKFKYVYPKMIIKNPKAFIEKFSDPLYINNTLTKSGYFFTVRETKEIINKEIVNVIREI